MMEKEGGEKEEESEREGKGGKEGKEERRKREVLEKREKEELSATEQVVSLTGSHLREKMRFSPRSFAFLLSFFPSLVASVCCPSFLFCLVLVVAPCLLPGLLLSSCFCIKQQKFGPVERMVLDRGKNVGFKHEGRTLTCTR